MDKWVKACQHNAALYKGLIDHTKPRQEPKREKDLVVSNQQSGQGTFILLFPIFLAVLIIFLYGVNAAINYWWF